MSGSALQREYDRFIAGLQEKYSLDEAVEPNLVRFVSVDEWARAQVDCLGEHGFSAEPNPQGGITWDSIPPEQAATQRHAAATCEARYPVDPRVNMQLPLVRAEKQYEFLVKVQLPCVEEAGYEVSAAPSMQTWLEQYYATGSSWDPFIEAANQTGPGSEGLDALYQACPPLSEEVYPPIVLD